MALPPINPVQAGISALPEIMKLISSFKQLSEAKKLEKTPNPQYNIPGQIREVTDTSRMNYLDPRIPGQNILEQNIRAGASNAMNQARGVSGGSGDALSALASINNGQNQQFNQLAVQGQQQQMSDLNNLNSALTNEAQYADKAWQWNKQQPYLNAMKSAGALRQASAENLFGAVNNLAGIGNTIDTKSLFGKGEKSLLPSTEQSSIGKSLGDMANAAKAIQSVNSMEQPSMRASEDVSFKTPIASPTPLDNTLGAFNPNATGNMWNQIVPKQPVFNQGDANVNPNLVRTTKMAPISQQPFHFPATITDATTSYPNGGFGVTPQNMVSATPTPEAGQYDNPAANRAMLADLFKSQSLTLPADQNMTYKTIYPNGSTGTMSLTELMNLKKQYPDLFK